MLSQVMCIFSISGTINEYTCAQIKKRNESRKTELRIKCCLFLRVSTIACGYVALSRGKSVLSSFLKQTALPFTELYAFDCYSHRNQKKE